MHSKTKISWFPGRDIEFKGKNSPPPTNYSPKEDKDFPNLHFSVGRQSRFMVPSSVLKV